MVGGSKLRNDVGVRSGDGDCVAWGSISSGAKVVPVSCMGESWHWPLSKGDYRIEPSGNAKKDIVAIVANIKLNCYLWKSTFQLSCDDYCKVFINTTQYCSSTGRGGWDRLHVGCVLGIKEDWDNTPWTTRIYSILLWIFKSCVWGLPIYPFVPKLRSHRLPSRLS